MAEYDNLVSRSHMTAWVAGFIDGEGCIHIYKQKYKSRLTGEHGGITHSLRISIGQNNLEVLERIIDILDIHAKIFKNKRNMGTNRQCYTLHINGKYALQTIELIKPYLVRKLPEALAAERFWEEGRKDLKTGRKPVPKAIMDIREWWYNKMRRMK